MARKKTESKTSVVKVQDKNKDSKTFKIESVDKEKLTENFIDDADKQFGLALKIDPKTVKRKNTPDEEMINAFKMEPDDLYNGEDEDIYSGDTILYGEKLTAMEADFVRFFIKYNCRPNMAGKALQEAGSMSKSLTTSARHLLSLPRIKRAIKARRSAIMKAVYTDEISIVNELNMIATSNIMDFVEIEDMVFDLPPDKEGVVRTIKRQVLTVKTLDDIPKDAWRVVQSIKQTKDGNIEIKLYDKLNALSQISDILGIKKVRDSEPANTDKTKDLPFGYMVDKEMDDAGKLDFIASVLAKQRAKNTEIEIESEVVEGE